MSKFTPGNNYIVQVYCTEMGWAESIHGGETLEAAELAEKRLREDDSRWVNPNAPKQTRIIHKSESKWAK